MPDVVVLLLAACGTALATGLGAIPVFFLGERAAQLTPLLLGFAAGVMGVASIAGLLIPAAEEGSAARRCSAGLAVGAGSARRGPLAARRPTPHFMGRTGPGARTSALVFLVLFVHSLPEGFAVGTAFASDRAGLSLFVILAIAIQNIPEGTSVAIPMAAAGFSRTPPVLGGGRDQRSAAGRRPDRLSRWSSRSSGLLPFSFAFAAGAMLALIAVEMLPQAYSGRRGSGRAPAWSLGAAVMLGAELRPRRLSSLGQAR